MDIANTCFAKPCTRAWWAPPGIPSPVNVCFDGPLLQSTVLDEVRCTAQRKKLHCAIGKYHENIKPNTLATFRVALCNQNGYIVRCTVQRRLLHCAKHCATKNGCTVQCTVQRKLLHCAMHCATENGCTVQPKTPALFNTRCAHCARYVRRESDAFVLLG